MTESLIYSIVRIVAISVVISVAITMSVYMLYQAWLAKQIHEAEKYRIGIIHMNDTWFTAGMLVGFHGRLLKLEEFKALVAQSNPERSEQIDAFIKSVGETTHGNSS